MVMGIVSYRTCGDDCWHAREDTCRCSCGGRNHGILRTADGSQPTRTRRMDGHMYQMLAVESKGGPDSCRAQTMRPIEDQKRDIMDRMHAAGTWRRWDYDSTPGYPVKIKTAGMGEVERWPELAAWRPAHEYDRPLVSWIRVDMAS